MELNIDNKLETIHQLESGAAVQEIVMQFGISEQTVCDIKKGQMSFYDCQHLQISGLH